VFYLQHLQGIIAVLVGKLVCDRMTDAFT